MINQNSIDKVDNSILNSHFSKPLYDSYCFSNIPELITKLLIPASSSLREPQGTNGGFSFNSKMPDDVLGELKKEYKNIVLIFIDGFGWEFFEKHKDKYPFLSRFVKEGVISKLTSQFPSTTVAHVTTLNTGKHVGETGFFEWRIYEPSLDSIILPLKYSPSRGEEYDKLRKMGVEPEDFLPENDFYNLLSKNGVKTNIYLNKEFANSSYNDVMSVGANVVPYKSLSEGLVNLAEDIKSAEGKNYFYYYYEVVDGMAHKHSPNSKYHEAEIDTVLTSIERLLMDEIDKNGETLVMLTADHGHIAVDSTKTVYINQIYPEIEQYIRRGKDNELLVPAGSPRDMFVYVEEDSLLEVRSQLALKLDGIAEVYTSEELIEKGLFGDVSQEFRDRIGNLIILPYEGETVWWYEEEFEVKKKGMHGGLSKKEMEIPLGVVRV